MYRYNNMDNTTSLPIYHKCDVCDYTSILKANYDRHCMTKKHLKNIEKHIEKVEDEADSTIDRLGGQTSQKFLEKDDEEYIPIEFDFNAGRSHEGLNKAKVVEIAEKYFKVNDDVRPDMIYEIIQSGVYLDGDVNQLETEYQKNRIIWGGLTEERKIIEARDMLPYDKLRHYCHFVYIVEKYVSDFEPAKKITISCDDDLFYATKIYNTLFELKRQYPNKYQFVRNTDRMKREWKRWSQEQFDNDYVYCYTKWFREISKVNQELIGKFVF